MRTIVSSPLFSFPAVTIARYTIKGYIKERVLLVVLVFGFLLMISSYVLAPLAVGAQTKIIIDVGLASVSIFGVLLVILMGASSYSRERDKGILPGILAKPVSRVDFVIGKFLGTCTTVAVVMLCMAAVFGLVMLMSHTAFNTTILVSVYLSVLEVALITAVLSFFSSFTSPLLSSLFTMFVFIAGHLSTDLLEFARHFGGVGFKVVASAGYYILPNLSLFNVRSEAVHDLPLLDGFVGSVTIYGVFYTAVLLFLSSLIFRRKDVA